MAMFGFGTRAKAEEQKEISRYCLYLGQSVKMADLPEGKIVFSNSQIVSISEEKVVKALKPGKTTLSVQNEEETVEYCTIEVRANELLTGLSFTQNQYQNRILSMGAFYIKEKAFEGMYCTYRSANEAIAKVDNSGKVTPIAAGAVNIYVAVTDYYGGTYQFTIPIRILRPHFQVTSMNLAKGCSATLQLMDCGSLQPIFTTSDVATVTASPISQSVTIKAFKTGKAIVTANISGVTVSCTITITDPKLKVKYGFYERKKGVTLQVTGLNSASKKQWSSVNASIATVSDKGRVTTKKMGSTVIQCKVDGKTLKYYLAVSSKTAVKAMRYGYKQVGKKKYSQVYRMSKNYFDCSSFVYRCYRSAGKYLVAKSSWAPVAADIARYYVQKGKRINTKKVYDYNKLRPGDLVCFGGKKAKRNGRYQRIYHIAMYIGNGKTMESSSTYNNVVIKDRKPLKKSDVPVIVRPA